MAKLTAENRRLLTLIGLAVVTLALWSSPVLWPLRMLVVVFHELSHAAAAIATGGSVVEIGLSPREGGHALTRGGWHFVVLNAGYLGSMIFGVGLLAAGRQQRTARAVLVALSAVLIGSALWWVRPIISFGVGFVLVSGTALALVAWRGGPTLTQLLLRWVGTVSVLYALWDIRDDVLSGRDGVSDAVLLAQATGIPAIVWGVAWLGIGAVTLWITRRWWL